MKLLLIGDSHLQINKFDLCCKFLEWIDQVVINEKPDLVINLGDSFHSHAVLRSEILSEFRKHIKHVTSLVPYFYVLGNHDFAKVNDSKYHALETFKDIANFKVIDKPTHSKNLGMSFIPYIPNPADFPMQTESICIAHQTFVGADYGSFRPESGVDADKMSADIIISGHIHKRQSFGKVIYPGTPYAQGINDINQSKGLMLFDTETFEISYIDSPFPMWKGMKFEVSDTLSMNDIHKEIIGNINTKDHWTFEIHAPKAELLAYMDSAKYKQCEFTFNIKPMYNDKDKHVKVQIKSSSMRDIVAEYIDKVYGGGLDKTIIKDKALEILKKVNI